jgi:hypothetical protein
VVSVVDRANGTGAKKVHFRLDNAAEQVAATSAGASGAATVTVPEGRHVLEFWGEDEGHAVEKSHHTMVVLVDKTKPTVTITSDQKKTSYKYGEQASVTTTAADENDLAANPSGARQRIPTNKAGKNTVTRTATDVCGNSASATFTYDVGKQVVAAARSKTMRLGVTPRVVYAGERMRFDFTAYDPAGSVRAARTGLASVRTPVVAATIRFAGHRLRTDRRGRAHITLALPRAGRYNARATRRGYRSVSASISARTRAVVVPHFTG